MNRCPQCTSRECGPIRCRFTMIEHKDAAPQASPSVAPAADAGPADAAPIGYEAAWPFEMTAWTGVPKIL